MIITKTPFRMSFFGGGTDLKEFYEKHGGAVISSTFDKYCYVTVRHLPRFFDYKNQITYSKIERVNGVDEIEHPLVRNAMRMLDMHELIVTYDADLPARTGLGTSSSFAVGLLNAFHSLKGKQKEKRQLADEAIYVERTMCNEAGGLQDQIAASFGGFNRIDFNENGYTVRPVAISEERKEELNDRLMLFFTGFSRFSADIQNDTKKNIQDNTERLLKMKDMVDEAEKILVDENEDLDRFGILLDQSWRLKRSTGNKISTNQIDAIYERALNAGALGGKLLGAGGGGFVLLYVPKDRQEEVRRELKDLLLVPFRFENEGTSVIYYVPEDFELQEEKHD
ncbi:MAG: kinase [Erysipelotrichaceae bacterium]|nr:kinase [Erysipelotrichaceae bacterium]